LSDGAESRCALLKIRRLVKKINDFPEKILDKRDDWRYIIFVAKLFCVKVINGTKEGGEEE